MWQVAAQEDLVDGEEILLTAGALGGGADALAAAFAGISIGGGTMRREKGKLLLVLDLNGLFVHRVAKAKVKKEEKERGSARPVAAGKKYWCWVRPHAEEFAEFVFENFQVLPWSSAMRVNVEILIDIVMQKHKSKIIDIFDQSMCTEAGKHPMEIHKPLFLKDLSKVWAKHPEFSAHNTLLVDDSLYKAILNPAYTAIHPKEWTHDQEHDNALAENGSIRGFLEKLAEASRSPDFKGVPQFIESEPFESGYSTKEQVIQSRIRDVALDNMNPK